MALAGHTGDAASVGIVLALLVGLNALVGPPERVVIRRDPAIDRSDVERIDAARPAVVLLGNSMLGQGIDAPELSRRTGLMTLKLVQGGSASAWWYLAVKNLVLASEHRVPLLVLFFRDHFLTHPTFRVAGPYKEVIDAIAGPSEPELDRLAYLDGMDPATHLLSRTFPLYQRRAELRGRAVAAVKHGAARALLGLEPAEADAALARVFEDARLDPELLGRSQVAAESPATPDVYDFARNVERSFLPLIVRLAEENGTRLVFVRVKRRRDLTQAQAPELVRYTDALRAWLDARDIPLLDFSTDERLGAELFGAGDHLDKERGRAVFTRLVAEALRPYTEPLRAELGRRAEAAAGY